MFSEEGEERKLEAICFIMGAGFFVESSGIRRKRFQQRDAELWVALSY